MPEEIYLSQTDYAKHRGVSQQRISALMSQGKFEGCTKKFGKYTRIHRDKADKVLSESLDRIYNIPGSRPNGKESKSRKKPDKAEIKATTNKAGTGGISLADAQKVQAQYKAALLKLEYDQKMGKLVDQEQVNKDWFDVARITRDAILNISDRVAAELASISDPYEINKRLTKEFVSVLTELKV